MNALARVFATIAVAMLSAVTIYPVTLKIASIAPEQSPWGQTLNQLAADLSKLSSGQVVLKFYHGGITGDEQDMLRKIRIGQLQGGVFTSVGLGEISADVFTLSAPFLIQNDAELDYVMGKTRAGMEADIESRKFKVIAWSKGGWIYFFTRKPIHTPADLKAMKLGVSDNDLADVWKQVGFNSIRTSSTEIMSKLNANMIEAFYSSPIATAAYQWFGLANNMSELKISPFIGGIVFSQAAWNQIPEAYRPELMRLSRAAEIKLNRDIAGLEGKAIDTMKKYGLSINAVNAKDTAEWESEFKTALNTYMTGNSKAFSKTFYATIEKHLQEYRKQKK
ncbi:MAG: TRAP transporter substrate-binding protein DctP [Spirochaetes bacterium]|nr:TRAP transporter substrate-binding protein DctP [Spirochaetota bacterium]